MTSKRKLRYTDAEPAVYRPVQVFKPAQAQVTVSVAVVYCGPHCWQCNYARSGGPYCELFRKALAQKTYPGGGDPPTRCKECIAAVAQPSLFAGLDKRRKAG